MSNMATDTDLALVGDFGGTNVRLALTDLSTPVPAISRVRHYLTKDFDRAVDTVAAWLADEGTKPRTVVVAAAGPVSDGAVHFTNLGWDLAEADFAQLGFSAGRIINDFVALALATRLLDRSDVRQIGGGQTDSRGNVAVLGPGTGFGASALVVGERQTAVPVAAEGGHASFAPDDDVEIEILKHLQRTFGHVSIERILSGPGLLNLYQALCVIEGARGDVEDSQGITDGALVGEPACLRTVERFCAVLGSVAGNLALTYGAKGGVYIAGGMVPRVVPILERSRFRERFESKGRFADYLRPIATQVIVRTDAAFLGAAQAARDMVMPR